MKLREEPTVIERGGNIVESMFGISAQDSAHILNILRSKLYSNKVLAVVREYCANAQDAHAEVNKHDQGIKVYLPNRFDPTFRVRDFGPGLSEDDVRNLYVMYGASTKRTSNNAIGQLGLGCKAAFAYTDKFHVVSWHGGEKKTYCAYIDETKCGKIALMSTEKSNESEGIEVQVPVKSPDFNTFIAEATSLLPFFSPLPEVHGAELDRRLYWLEGKSKSGATFKIQQKQTNDGRYYGGRSSYVIMGGIPYPIKSDKIDTGTWGSPRSRFLDLGVDIYVEIGDLEVTANREDLEYTDHTKQCLEKHIDSCAETALEVGANSIQHAQSYKDANVRYHNMMQDQAFWKDIRGKYDWHGLPLDGKLIASTSATILKPGYYGRGIRWNDDYNIPANEDIHVFEIDNPKNWRPKLAAYIEHHSLRLSNVRVIRWDTNQKDGYGYDRDAIFKNRRLDEWEIKKISDCKVPQNVLDALQQKGIAVQKSTTHIGTVFTLKGPDQRAGTARTRSKNWNRVTKIPPEQKYYVVIDKFRPFLSNKLRETSTVDAFLKAAKLLGHDIPTSNVYGIKKAQADKITGSSDWVALDKFVKDKLTGSKLAIDIADYQEYAQHATYSCIQYAEKSSMFPAQSIARKLLNEVSRLKSTHDRIKLDYEQLKAVVDSCQIVLPKPSASLTKLMDETATKYPLADTAGIFPRNEQKPYYYRHVEDTRIDKALPHIASYVELVEKCQEESA